MQEFIAKELHRVLPEKVKNTLVCFQLGTITGTDGILRKKVVPEITIDEILQAIKRQEENNG